MNTLNGTSDANTNVDATEGMKHMKETQSNGIRQRILSFFSLSLLLVLCVLPVHAQRYLASLTGSVSDPTSAKIVGATVTATDLTTKFSTKAVTNGSGDYSIPFLTPDTYDVAVEAKGFRTETSTGVVLTAGADVRTDFTLSVGS